MSDKASGKTSDKAKGGLLRFSRADYLGTEIVLGVAAAGSVMFGLVEPAVDAITNTPLPVSFTTKITGDLELPRGASHDGNITMELLLRDATLGERLTQAIPGLILVGMTISIAWLVFQLLRSTQAKEPFTRRNVRRVNLIALIVGIGGVLVQLAQSVADSAIQTSGRLPDPPVLIFEFSFTPVPLVAMLVIALVGEVLRRGVKLRDDVEGLV